MGYQEEIGLARAQERLFGLLAACLTRPDRELANALMRGDVSARFGDLLSFGSGDRIESALGAIASFERDCAESSVDDVRLCLEVDYNRLFVGPAALLAPPYESCYASEAKGSGGRLRTEEERAVAAEYRRYGYAVPEPLVELPDHIAVELEFLSRMAGREARAWESGAAEAADAMRFAQASFLENHLRTWAGTFATRVESGARTAFYPGAAALVAEFSR